MFQSVNSKVRRLVTSYSLQLYLAAVKLCFMITKYSVTCCNAMKLTFKVWLHVTLHATTEEKRSRSRTKKDAAPELEPEPWFFCNGSPALVVTSAYCYRFVEFISRAKCVLLPSKRNKITTVNVLFLLLPHFSPIFLFKLCTCWQVAQEYFLSKGAWYPSYATGPEWFVCLLSYS